jgi:hypothetical protein
MSRIGSGGAMAVRSEAFRAVDPDNEAGDTPWNVGHS